MSASDKTKDRAKKAALDAKIEEVARTIARLEGLRHELHADNRRILGLARQRHDEHLGAAEGLRGDIGSASPDEPEDETPARDTLRESYGKHLVARRDADHLIGEMEARTEKFRPRVAPDPNPPKRHLPRALRPDLHGEYDDDDEETKEGS